MKTWAHDAPKVLGETVSEISQYGSLSLRSHRSSPKPKLAWVDGVGAPSLI